MKAVDTVASFILSTIFFGKGLLLNLEFTDSLECVPTELQGLACLCQLRVRVIDVTC